MKKFFIFVLCFYTPYSSGGIKSICKALFSKEMYPSILPENFNSTLVKIIAEGHYTAYQNQWLESEKEFKDFSAGLELLKEFTELSFHSTRETAVVNSINPSVEKAIKNIPEIINFVQRAPPEESPYFQQTALAILVLFSKHIPTALKEEPNHTDWPRINAIIHSIVNFDPHKPRFSLYKIKRSIEGRYSLKEFILCRM